MYHTYTAIIFIPRRATRNLGPSDYPTYKTHLPFVLVRMLLSHFASRKVGTPVFPYPQTFTIQ